MIMDFGFRMVDFGFWNKLGHNELKNPKSEIHHPKSSIILEKKKYLMTQN
jgi:hypothetical protein